MLSALFYWYKCYVTGAASACQQLLGCTSCLGGHTLSQGTRNSTRQAVLLKGFNLDFLLSTKLLGLSLQRGGVRNIFFV